MAIPLLIFKGYIWSKENGQEEEYFKQYKEYFGVNFYDNSICFIGDKRKHNKS